MIESRLDEWFFAALETSHQNQSDEHNRLSQLTVVIPSYNRQDFLLRQAVYWSNSAARVVIIDGSPNPLSESRKNAVLAQTNLKYLHLPESFSVRLNLAAQHIHTPYAVFLPDDEFFLKKGLSRAIERLDNSPSLVACVGQAVDFVPSNDGTTCVYTRRYPKHWQYEIAHDSVRQRLLAAMSDYTIATYFAVLREPIWSRSFGKLKNWSSPYVAELQQAFLTYVYGEISTVEDLYWLRSRENSPVSLGGEWNRSLRAHEWWVAPKYLSERENFVELLAEAIVSTEQLELTEARHTIQEAMDAYSKGRPVHGIASATRGLVKAMLKKVLSERRLLSLKATLFRPERPKEELVLTNPNNADQADQAQTFLFDDDLASEIAEVERLISGFHQARLGDH